MRLSALSPLALGVCAALVLPLPATSYAQAATAPMSCEALAGVTVANTTITTAETVAAGAFTPPVPQAPGPSGNFAALPAFCRVTGTIAPTADSDIRFELWLPAENWNGRFLQTGNGGAAGAIVHGSLVDPLLRGYAVANTDTGHQGGGGDFAWAAGHPQKLTDYAHRAVHELTVTGKALTTARFGSAPEKSYWVGCSTGGRQGLKEAQRYPEDYDAIVAGAPANNWSALMALSIVIQNNIIAPGGLGIDKLGILKEAAIASCDALDGVSDRVITNTAQCAFDPAATQCAAGQSAQCLSAAEVAAATRIYQGVVTASGETRFPGTGPASEPLWAAYASPGFGIGSSYFREVVVGDPAWDAASFNVDRDLARAEEVDNGEHIAMNPDLSAFFAHGGKLLTYHGTTDGLIPYRNTVNYYESVVARMGEALVAANMRLYLVPGMDHCAGGEGAFMVDWLTALEDWVEDGTAPATLPAARPAGMPGTPAGSSGFTRPLCPYPQVAQYKGGGATTDAANFSCRAP